MTPQSTTLEILLNGRLAELLRQQGLEAEAEQVLKDHKGNRHQIDVLVELEDQAVAIEAEFAPARTVQADARKRLPAKPLLWRGLPISSAFTLVYPQELQKRVESRARKELEERQDLEFAQFLPEEIHTQHQLFPEAAEAVAAIGATEGSVTTLAECLHSFWLRADSSNLVEQTIEEAATAIGRATECLRRSPDVHPHADADTDAAATSALIWLNALLFQELLAQNLDAATLPPPHTGKRISPPDANAEPDRLNAQWNEILEINWWPIFHYAREALQYAPVRPTALALRELQPVARAIARRGVIRRHDIVGRIFHRLLKTRKFLATNYTTIPAAVLLASLAFDREAEPWNTVRWSDPEEISRLRIADPACGTGTLLMAAVQEILKAHRRQAEQAEEPQTVRKLLENTIHGYDVVPAAIHLTAATLAMAESRQVINDMPLYWMPHNVQQRARLGSLDFLRRSAGKGKAHHLPMFPEATEGPQRRTGTGEAKHDVFMPECDLVIANPPYTRAGGPGSAENTAWNPIFGSVLSSEDAKTMQRELKRMLTNTPASIYAGRGSAFVTLADEKLKAGGRLAFVLPATTLTGSRWAPIRKLLLNNYDIEWVVVSHDKRYRSARQGLPGRRHVGFSESTRIAETLIVATKKRASAIGNPSHGITRFVNLRHNPDEPIEAIAIAKAILAMKQADAGSNKEIIVGPKAWGEILYVAQNELTLGPWVHTVFTQSRLTQTAVGMLKGSGLHFDRKKLSIETTQLGVLADIGPYHMQIKNPKQGLFDIVETGDLLRSGHPALWHHDAETMKTLETKANARLHERSDQTTEEQEAMLQKAGHLQIACELGHAPQRLAAVRTNEPMLGVSSWTTANLKTDRAGAEEALCLWLNSTPGILLRVCHANRPYLGRSRLPHELMRILPVLNVETLEEKQLQRASVLFSELKDKSLEGFAQLASDPVRRELDRRLLADVLGYDEPDMIDRLATALNNEPMMTTRH